MHAVTFAWLCPVGLPAAVVVFRKTGRMVSGTGQRTSGACSGCHAGAERVWDDRKTPRVPPDAYTDGG